MLKDEPTMISVSCSLKKGEEEAFHKWQAHLNTAASLNSGFISSEVTFSPPPQEEWVIVQRFKTAKSLKAWEESTDFEKWIKELEKYTVKESIKYGSSHVASTQNGVTEIFVTEVSPGKEAEFQKWNAKINEAESKFSGFRGACLQAPTREDERLWITMIRFDTIENLEKWLASKERKDMLRESEALIASVEGHRWISPYAGWFSSVSKGAEAPPGWKQAMVVLLVLFPIVMLEFIVLAPLKNLMNLSMQTFIGNAISVGLLTYPCMPIAIKSLSWWLNPPKDKYKEYTLKGFALIAGLYVLEVIIFSFMF